MNKIALAMVMAAFGSHAIAQEQTTQQQSGSEQKGSGQALCPL